VVQTLASLKQRQGLEKNPWLGVDCKQAGTNDMKVQKVLETLHGKKQQFLLATQVEYSVIILCS
jgi:T-complex protein 1 subunit epsilon